MKDPIIAYAVIALMCFGIVFTFIMPRYAEAAPKMMKCNNQVIRLGGPATLTSILMKCGEPVREYAVYDKDTGVVYTNVIYKKGQILYTLGFEGETLVSITSIVDR